MSYPGDGGPANGLMPAASEPLGALTAPPQGQLKPPPQGNDAPQDGMMEHMTGQYDKQVGYYKKLREAAGRTTVARSTLDSLVKLGDMVTQQDVVDGASKLVGAGLGAEAIAGMLADMPPDGPALMGWLQQQDGELKQREQQLAQATQMVRFQMGTNALKLLATHAMHGTHLPSPQENPLMNGAPAQ